MIINASNRSVHDNYIVNALIDIENSNIILSTKYENENTVILFENVLCHSFENIINQNIILDITEYNISEFIDRISQHLLNNKKYCDPPINWENIDDLKTKLTNLKYFGYDIYSSIGLNGWVISKQMIIK